MDKLLGRLGDLAFVRQPVKEKEYFEFKSVELYLKIGLVSHPCGGFG